MSAIVDIDGCMLRQGCRETLRSCCNALVGWNELVMMICNAVHAERRSMEAWRSEFWPPAGAEGALAIVTDLAHKCAWLADPTARRQFAIAVPQVSHLDTLPTSRLRWHVACELLESPPVPRMQLAGGTPR
jgi:hypothetical protein